MGLTEMDEYWMKIALEKAEEAFQAEEVPVGAVIVESSGRHFADRNRTAETGMPTSHAEHLVITAAAEDREDWRLEGCTLYSTLEPCLMCAGLALLARIPRIVFGAQDKRFGAFGSVTDVLKMQGLNHYPEVFGGYYEDESARLLKEFFRLGRKKKKAKGDTND
ncbi:MAG: nucleoside deaminase [Candidatus Aegiribacteria sp.]|nr:nucleoside deaminase [Candidatus Aegiribacteria sp.]